MICLRKIKKSGVPGGYIYIYEMLLGFGISDGMYKIEHNNYHVVLVLQNIKLRQ